MEEKKILKISLYKKEIFYDIDALSYKFADASMSEKSAQAKNAVQSDSTETLDGSIIKRLTEKRDADLRLLLMWCLVSEDVSEVTNIPEGSDVFEYRIYVDKDYSGDKAKILAKKMHEYLVRGSLQDWYFNCGIANSSVSREVLDLESTINGLVRKSHTKRPFQPFGPAEETY